MESATQTLTRQEHGHEIVAQVMHRGVITCQIGTPVAEVARLMTEHDVSAIPVVDEGGYLAGIITRIDLVALRARNDNWRRLKAENVMTRQLATITPDKTLAEASQLMIEKKIHRLLVIEVNEQLHALPLGILSQTDIVRDMSRDA